jgi:sugar transferase (PEP-CTERM/EpsH1 system associated)
MKVLYLCHRIPYPPNKGDKIRAFYQLKTMSARHEVHVFTLADDPADLMHQAALAPYCRRLTVARIDPRLARLRALPYLVSRQPLTIPYFYSAGLAQAVRQALDGSFERVFVYCSAMMQYVEHINHPPIVTDLVDVDSDKWMQYARLTRFPMSAVYHREARLLRDYERRICGAASCVVVTTEREAEVLREIAPQTSIEVVPNGVDIDFFSPQSIPVEAGVPSIVFTGDMSYFPNEDAVCFFARDVLPLIRRAVKGTRFRIVGRNPGSTVRALSKLEGVEVTGFVPDVRTYLAQSQVAVAPFRVAAGIQNKILEAMAYGLPVVATTRAAQGLAPGIRRFVNTGDSPEELASVLIVLLRDPAVASRKGTAGSLQVRRECRWEAPMERLMGLLEAPSVASRDTPSGVLGG